MAKLYHKLPNFKLTKVAPLMVSKKWFNYATGLPNLKLPKHLYIFMKCIKHKAYYAQFKIA